MRKARWLGPGVALSSVLVAIAACGGDDEGGSGTQTQEPTSGIVEDAGPTDTTDASGATSDASAPGDAGAATTYSGQATYYKANGTGACGQTIADSQLVGAMNKPQYGKSVCGKCAQIKGPNGTVVVKIEDECPGCAYGDIDLSSTAFAKIAKLSDGRVKITWSFVPCP